MSVSVVIPAFNAAEWLPTALESALDQGPDNEIIVVNDGSTDSTDVVLDRYPGIRTIRQLNLGLAAARNAGIAVSRRDFVMCLDADDELLPGAIAKLLEALRAHPLSVVATSDYLLRPANGIDTRGWDGWRHPNVLRREDLATLIRHNRLAANSLYRTTVFAKRSFAEHLKACEDLEFWARTLLEGDTVVLVDEPLVRVAVRRLGSLTSSKLTMRHSRRVFFDHLLGEALTVRERWLVRYMLAKSAFGESLVAGRRPDEFQSNTVLARAAWRVGRLALPLVGRVDDSGGT